TGDSDHRGQLAKRGQYKYENDGVLQGGDVLAAPVRGDRQRVEQHRIDVFRVKERTSRVRDAARPESRSAACVVALVNLVQDRGQRSVPAQVLLGHVAGGSEDHTQENEREDPADT